MDRPGVRVPRNSSHSAIRAGPRTSPGSSHAPPGLAGDAPLTPPAGARFASPARSAQPFGKLADDLDDDVVRRIADGHHDRVLVRRRLLEGRELAVEQRHRHEVLVPRRHARADQVSRAFQVGERHVGTSPMMMSR